MRRNRLAGIALMAWLSLSTGAASAALIQSGFNDVTGINGDGIANNIPFNIHDAPLDGQGAAEPGWAGPWRVSGSAVVQSTTVFEGDGAAAFFGNTASATRVLGLSPTDRFRIDLHLLIPRSITRDVIFRVYDSTIADPFVSISVQWQVAPDFSFRVVNGMEDACPTDRCVVEDTGFRLTPGVWTQVSVEIDPVSRKWDFFVDGMRFQAPAPLGFRGMPRRLDAIEFLNEIAAPDGSYLDAVVINTDLSAGALPEPTSAVLLGLSAVGLLTRLVQRGRPKGSAGL
jgi:hypothetical protein